MTFTNLWPDSRKILLFLGLFAVCCLFENQVRAWVAADTLSDMSLIVLQGSTLVAFVGCALLALVAARRAERRPARIALRVLPAALVLVGATYAKASYADVSVALQALTDKPEGATALDIGPSGRDVRLSGDLTEGAATRLAALLDTHPSIQRVELKSEGGLADEGEALRKVIAARRLTTYVPDYCVSACTLAFLGGRERLIVDEAQLGFHSPYEEGLFGQTFAADFQEERAHYLAAGVTPDFVERVFKVSPDDVWTPKSDQLLAAHIATRVVESDDASDAGRDSVGPRTISH